MAFAREHFQEFENLLNAVRFFRYFLFQFFFFVRRWGFCCVSPIFRYQFCKIEINKLQLKDLEETTLMRIFLRKNRLRSICALLRHSPLFMLFSSSPPIPLGFYSKAYERIKKSFLFVNLLNGHEQNHKMQINRVENWSYWEIVKKWSQSDK